MSSNVLRPSTPEHSRPESLTREGWNRACVFVSRHTRSDEYSSMGYTGGSTEDGEGWQNWRHQYQVIEQGLEQGWRTHQGDGRLENILNRTRNALRNGAHPPGPATSSQPSGTATTQGVSKAAQVCPSCREHPTPSASDNVLDDPHSAPCSTLHVQKPTSAPEHASHGFPGQDTPSLPSHSPSSSVPQTPPPRQLFAATTWETEQHRHVGQPTQVDPNYRRPHISPSPSHGGPQTQGTAESAYTWSRSPTPTASRISQPTTAESVSSTPLPDYHHQLLRDINQDLLEMSLHLGAVISAGLQSSRMFRAPQKGPSKTLALGEVAMAVDLLHGIRVPGYQALPAMLGGLEDNVHATKQTATKRRRRNPSAPKSRQQTKKDSLRRRQTAKMVRWADEEREEKRCEEILLEVRS